jgi:hypothetical protein
VRQRQDLAVVQACVPNIGPRGSRARLLRGAVACGVAIAVAALLVRGGAAPATHLLLLPLFGYAALGYFQAREKT